MKNNKKEKIEELTLLLMYLTSWENYNTLEENYKHTWKGNSFEVINHLTNKGCLFPTKYSNKLVKKKILLLLLGWKKMV